MNNKRFKVSEFSAIILAAEHDIYPILSSRQPLNSLPFGNIPLIHWQLDFLQNSGFESCIIVTYEEQVSEIQLLVNGWLAHHKVSTFNLRFFQTARSTSEVEALAQIGTQIKSDILVIGANFISTVPITDIADIHRVQDSTVTMAVRTPRRHEFRPSRAEGSDGDAWDRMQEENVDSSVRLYLGVHKSEKRHEVCHRVLLYDHHFKGHQDDSSALRISKSVLRAHPRMKVFTDLSPCRVAVLSSWVMAWLTAHPDLAGSGLYSVWNDLIPVLVSSQLSEDPTMKNFQTRADKNRQFQERSTGLQIGESAVAYKKKDMKRRKCFVFFHPPSDLDTLVWNWKSFRKMNFQILRGSISAEFRQTVSDRNCKVKVQQDAADAGNPLMIFEDISDLEAKEQEEDEMQVNEGCESEGEEDVSANEEEDKVEISKVCKTIFGDKVQVGKGCTIKFCTIGSNCKIGDHCVLDHCLLLDGVTIEEGTQLENTIVSFKSTVGSLCKLTQCVVAFEQNVPPGTESRNATFDETIGIKEFGVRVQGVS